MDSSNLKDNVEYGKLICKQQINYRPEDSHEANLMWDGSINTDRGSANILKINKQKT